MGSIDRIIRFVLGFALLSGGLVLHSWWGVAGLVPIFTASVRFCPAYLPFGINTCAVSCDNDKTSKESKK